MVLIMTVQPGFGGQKYMEECTEKIREVRELIEAEDLDVDVQVDVYKRQFLAIVSGRTDFLNPSTADCWNHFVYICGSFSACNSSGRIQCFFKSVENAWKFRNAWKR